MDDAANIATAMKYLRMRYTGAAGIVSLHQLADTVAVCAFDAVTIIGQGFEGGQANGQLVFPKMAYLEAVISLIAELDPENTPAPMGDRSYARFSPAPGTAASAAP